MSKLVSRFKNNRKLLVAMILMAIIPTTINYGIFYNHFGTYQFYDCTNIDLSGFKGETKNDKMTTCEFYDGLVTALNTTIWGFWVVNLATSLLAVLMFFLYGFRNTKGEGRLS